MEGDHPPLLADVLAAAPFAGRATVVAPLFLSPGRHAGPDGDIAQICADAFTGSGTRCHLAELVGTHPVVVDALAAALQESLSHLHAHLIA
jgi:sirohydrochlorin ferrochelatase